MDITLWFLPLLLIGPITKSVGDVMVAECFLVHQLRTPHHRQLCLHDWMNLSRSSRDEPPSAMAAIPASLMAITLSLTSFPFSVNSFTRFSNSVALTNSSSISNSSANFNSFTNATLFHFCSAYSGQATIGTPELITSRIEFHPQ